MEQSNLIVDVGRESLRMALADRDGRLDTASFRTFEAATNPSVSDSIRDFLNASGRRCFSGGAAVSVAGSVNGDVVRVTNSRWIVSCSGIGAMLRTRPLVMNDFVASAWALLAEAETTPVQSLSGGALDLGSDYGNWCLIGFDAGLGVATLTRHPSGQVSVSPSEAAHAAFPGGHTELDTIIHGLKRRSPFLSVETLISDRGLASLYSACLPVGRTGITEAETVISLAHAGDRAAMQACDLFAQAVWFFAGNLALTLGAWKGVILTGRLAHALERQLSSPAALTHFVIPGPHARAMAQIPKGITFLDRAELVGAARALAAQNRALAA